MREALLDRLRCPKCQAERSFRLEAAERDEREIREGELHCDGCGLHRHVRRGIVDLLLDPPDFVSREAAGLGRFAEVMDEGGWDRDRILGLPDKEESGYWYVQTVSMNALVDRMDFQPGETLLDVGSNTCWASNRFAELGMDVVALDITTTEMQGLETADYWLEARDTYFERLLSTMFGPALASNSMDYVFCCEVLHHNDRAHLDRTMAELFRVLKPGGRLLVINEPLRFLTDLKRDHATEVAQFEGNEHVYFAFQYMRAARRAGFAISVEEPMYVQFFRGYNLRARSLKGLARRSLPALARRIRPARRAYLHGRNLMGRDVAFNMIGTKPSADGA